MIDVVKTAEGVYRIQVHYVIAELRLKDQVLVQLQRHIKHSDLPIHAYFIQTQAYQFLDYVLPYRHDPLSFILPINDEETEHMLYVTTKNVPSYVIQYLHKNRSSELDIASAFDTNPHWVRNLLEICPTLPNYIYTAIVVNGLKIFFLQITLDTEII